MLNFRKDFTFSRIVWANEYSDRSNGNSICRKVRRSTKLEAKLGYHRVRNAPVSRRTTRQQWKGFWNFLLAEIVHASGLVAARFLRGQEKMSGTVSGTDCLKMPCDLPAKRFLTSFSSLLFLLFFFFFFPSWIPALSSSLGSDRMLHSPKAVEFRRQALEQTLDRHGVHIPGTIELVHDVYESPYTPWSAFGGESTFWFPSHRIYVKASHQ